MPEMHSNSFSCFLSHRFDGGTSEASARQVVEFLQALGVRVATGSAYEPRSISEKVKSRIGQGHDFVVVLVDSGGMSPFCRDEINEARNLNLPVIPLVEEGSQFVSGLFGDLEYIRFAPGHVADGFTRLLQGVNAVRGAKEHRTLAAAESNVQRMAQRFDGLGIDEQAALYYCLAEDQRTMVREIDDPLVGGMRHKGIVSVAGGAFDPWKVPFTIPPDVWAYLKEHYEDVLPKAVTESPSFLSALKRFEARLNGRGKYAR